MIITAIHLFNRFVEFGILNIKAVSGMGWNAHISRDTSRSIHMFLLLGAHCTPTPQHWIKWAAQQDQQLSRPMAHCVAFHQGYLWVYREGSNTLHKHCTRTTALLPKIMRWKCSLLNWNISVHRSCNTKSYARSPQRLGIKFKEACIFETFEAPPWQRVNVRFESWLVGGNVIYLALFLFLRVSW